MVYVDRGCVKILRDGEEITLSQGEIVFHRPNEFHAIRAHESSPNFFVVSFVSSANAMRYFERYHTVLDKTLTPFISAVIYEAESTYEIPKNDPSLRKLIKKADAPIGGEQLIKTYLEQLLVLLIRNITREEKTALFPSKASMENHLVVAIKRLAEEKCEESFRVGDLCAALGYSESYLSKLFREQTGDTIAAYAIKVKIRFAKRMIREGLFNFSEISDRLHFDNPQYFSRVFKRVTGMSPTEFKSTLRLNA
jgi:AraC-like DNA-binding protein